MKNRGRINAIARWSTSLSFDQIPKNVVDRAGHQVLSVFAAIYSGAATQAGKILSDVCDRPDDKGAGAFPLAGRIPVEEAVRLHAGLSVALDFDDYLFLGHTGHSAVATPLAVGQSLGASGKDILTAQVIANEIEGRLGASTIFGPHNGQLWIFIHAAGAAAATAKLMGLSAEQTAHALAIALFAPPFTQWQSALGPHTKVLMAGEPAAFGVRAARLAARGFTGPLDVLDAPDGFYRHFSFLPARFFLEGFGRSWVTLSLAFKRYPGCAYIDTTVDALLEILDRIQEKTGAPIDPEQVEHVQVSASLLTMEMEHQSSRFVDASTLSPHNLNFSIPFNVAITLLAGELTVRQLDQAWLDQNATALRNLASKVNLSHDWKKTVRVFRTTLDGLGEMDLLSHLKVRDLVRLRRRMIAEYGKSIRIGVSDLRPFFAELSAQNARRLLSRMKQARGNDFGEVDFEAFRLPFPATVTVHLKGGETYLARQEIPFGANGAQDYPDAAVEKFRREAARVFDPSSVDKRIETVLDFENRDVDQIAAALLP